MKPRQPIHPSPARRVRGGDEPDATSAETVPPPPVRYRTAIEISEHVVQETRRKIAAILASLG